jgi:DNA-directed RNA polymerase subunit K/omega
MPPKKSQVIIRKYNKAALVDDTEKDEKIALVEKDLNMDNTDEEQSDHAENSEHEDHTLRKVVAGSSKKKFATETKETKTAVKRKMGEEVVIDIGDKIPELEVVSNKVKEKYEYKPLLHTEIVYTLPEDRITSEVMTKFELCEVISVRAKQIENGGDSFTDIGDLTDPLEIAKKEILDKKCPLDIIRMKTDKIAERWHVNEMGIPFD